MVNPPLFEAIGCLCIQLKSLDQVGTQYSGANGEGERERGREGERERGREGERKRGREGERKRWRDEWKSLKANNFVVM